MLVKLGHSRHRGRVGENWIVSEVRQHFSLSMAERLRIEARDKLKFVGLPLHRKDAEEVRHGVQTLRRTASSASSAVKVISYFATTVISTGFVLSSTVGL